MPDETRIYLVTISHSICDMISYPELRWIVTGVLNELAAIRVVMGDNVYIKPPYYDTVRCKRLELGHSSTKLARSYAI